MNKPPSESELVRVAPNFSYPSGSGSVLISDPTGAYRDLIPSAIADLLSRCVAFKTCAEHARDIWRELRLRDKRKYWKSILETHSDLFGEIIVSWSGFRRMLTGIFEAYAKKGLLVSAPTVFAWARSNVANLSSPDPIATLGAVTCNRVSELKSCLTSYIENGIRYQRKNDYQIFDDSLSVETRQQYRRLASELKNKFQVEIRYAGLEEKRQFADALIAADLPPDVINFALFDGHNVGSTYGANRNAFLLSTTGDLVLSVDDDTRGRVGRSPTFKEGLRLGAGPNIFEMWFYSNRAAALEAQPASEGDLFSLHEQHLGKTIGQSLDQLPGAEALDLEKAGYTQLKLVQKGEGRIFATFNGLVGDSGSNSPIPPLFSSGPQRERLLASEKSYRTAIRSREVCKATDRITVQRAGSCMTTFLGIDNRELLPPFFPIFRMEDAIFGEMINRCAADSCFAYLPWTLVHAPLEKRGHAEEHLTAEDSFWPNDAVLAALQTFQIGVEKPSFAEALRRVGEALMKFGSLPFDSYKEILNDYRQMLKAQKVSDYESLLRRHPGSPRYWIADVKKLLEQAKRAAVKEIVLAPQPLVEKLGHIEAEKMVQSLVYQYGQLVTWWPEIIRAARDLKSKGIKLARSIS